MWRELPIDYFKHFHMNNWFHFLWCYNLRHDKYINSEWACIIKNMQNFINIWALNFNIVLGSEVVT